jgi:hypothetical protein
MASKFGVASVVAWFWNSRSVGDEGSVHILERELWTLEGG